ncbi:hypothetical protein D1BOALGB6SA_3637 [Olavius sp. associated proteobacterium Delta 1]|nr:hypothetical protein D1BOALGB6SA_3637 [Olavius sp. associated proteobacterium Delta 1]
MRPTSWGVWSIIIGAVLAVSLTAPAYAGDEVFVVSSNSRGDANYMAYEGDDIFYSQEILKLIDETDIDVPFKFCYGNGLGDFDNDGDLDYITAIGYAFMPANIYIYRKSDAGNKFDDPTFVDAWGVSAGSEGYLAMDFAVADYNEDGNADFVMSLWASDSHATGFYLGDGDFGFESKLLPNTGTYDSAGADAADFNNDDHADFVIAALDESGDGQFFVSLGNGKGEFTTSSFNSHEGGPVSGVAAADFTGDGNADIVAAYPGILYVYEGAGDGETFTLLDTYDVPINQNSAIDNNDFNGDGSQDLVVASYAADRAGVAVLWGIGDGTFTYSATYLGGSDGDRYGVSGPPYEPNTNTDPVAVIEPTHLQVTAGQEIVFDGSGSYDEDEGGQIVSYEWDFGDGNSAAGVQTVLTSIDADRQPDGVNPSHIYYDTGSYTVTLVVTDDQGAKGTVTAEVYVEAVAAIVKFSPRKIYSKSRKKWIVATIKLPQNYDLEQVDRTRVSVSVGKSKVLIPAQPDPKHGFLAKIWCKIQRRMKVVTVRFDRQEILAAIGSASDNIDLTVVGEISHNGGRVKFTGSDQIKTFEKSKGWRFFKKWKPKKR